MRSFLTMDTLGIVVTDYCYLTKRLLPEQCKISYELAHIDSPKVNVLGGEHRVVLKIFRAIKNDVGFYANFIIDVWAESIVPRVLEILPNEIDHVPKKEIENQVEFRPGNIEMKADKSKANVAARSTIVDATGRNEMEDNVTKPNPFAWFLKPLTQKIHLSPQYYFDDRIARLRDALNNLGLNIRQEVTNKQLGNINRLLRIIGLNDAEFYTNRLEPAGFFGGNGWFANKGGLLGGPGALISTGSFLTDYPTSYRK